MSKKLSPFRVRFESMRLLHEGAATGVCLSCSSLPCFSIALELETGITSTPGKLKQYTKLFFLLMDVPIRNCLTACAAAASVSVLFLFLGRFTSRPTVTRVVRVKAGSVVK